MYTWTIENQVSNCGIMLCVILYKLNFLYLWTWFVICFWVFRSSVPRLFCDVLHLWFILCSHHHLCGPMFVIIRCMFRWIRKLGRFISHAPFFEKGFLPIPVAWVHLICQKVRERSQLKCWSCDSIILWIKFTDKKFTNSINWLQSLRTTYTVSPFNVFCYHEEIFQKRDFSA